MRLRPKRRKYRTHDDMVHVHVVVVVNREVEAPFNQIIMISSRHQVATRDETAANPDAFSWKLFKGKMLGITLLLV